MGAGGLQALVKSGLDIAGKRVVVAGTGPLLLAVAAYARKYGAKVVGICEQTTRPRLARFGLDMMLVPGKVAEALRFAYDLRGIPHWTDCWPVAAIGNRRSKAFAFRAKDNQRNRMRLSRLRFSSRPERRAAAHAAAAGSRKDLWT